MRTIAAAAAFTWFSLSPAVAWWDEGHMQIAYLAYKQLDPVVKEHADALLRINPDYANWIAGAPAGAEKLYAFVHAATWADDIKTKEDYYDDQVKDSTAKQIVPYGHLKHAYWHFKDTLYTPDGTLLPPPDPVDAVTQLKALLAKLPSSASASDPMRSYSLVWTLHLVGDLHQPLHAIARYTAQLPDNGGDRGGNAEKVMPATGETVLLHAYWDSLFGGYSSVFGAIADADDKFNGLKNVTPDTAKAQILDPAVWAQESFELAKQNAYASPIPNDATPVQLTRDYESNARNVARSQAALAAARLANLLNQTLK
ncbi:MULTISPECIES: S1/P1 nuclease [unclassified Bradyrhizobium]|uniref:S1/P1 nuclease n=1 Tax=unclassified Bradyrhizobium TaxID=2631580 RepID=UPI001BA76B64|nr:MULTISPECIES: S1/P1 nuclease [unclassified Bradyrhizobium]MBR1201846.1 S1/P1 nuclease [Bradyrhizobium sp. AUGA SZCCT0124]MBR1311585.1 S1/P1 nuclease [Bradyrhizobium sp. AUGA SZCCT0051]MBR1338795.1 S1/P1 nuclease [Bradyrhizobium sp. AUGA SZCCT0105]MBR1353369.1 S1/P1 nuclease [Bradyrhizobium sp. AUGA SZCCT0045]